MLGRSLGTASTYDLAVLQAGWPVPPAGDAGYTGSAPDFSQAVCAAVSRALSLSAARCLVCMGCVRGTCKRAEV